MSLSTLILTQCWHIRACWALNWSFGLPTNFKLLSRCLNTQYWALPQTGPQVRKSANCGLKVLVCGFANRFLTANICGFAVKKLNSTANPQINNIPGNVSAISKKRICFYDSMYRQIWVDDVFLKYNTL